MIHYDIVEWKLFREDLLDEKLKIEMEDHLLECDLCMGIFLELIDREVESRIENIPKVSKNFTDKLMNKINIKTEEKIERIQTQEETEKNKKELNKKELNKNTELDKYGQRKKWNKSRKNKYNEFLVYYLAVASVAIFLMGSGFFSQIVFQSPEFGERLIASKKEVRVDLFYNFSKDITDAASSFVKDFNLEIKEKR